MYGSTFPAPVSFREDGSNGKVELSVRYQQHSEENNLLGMIKGQVRASAYPCRQVCN